MEGRIVYFDRAGQDNTEEVLRIARKRAEELGIKTVLVASTTGETAVKAMEILKGLSVIAVSHSANWLKPNTQEFTLERRKQVEKEGGIVLTTTHAFAGVGRAMRKKFNLYSYTEIIANVLRLFGEGMKVAIEIAMMAADSGLVRVDEDVVAIGGTGRGVDTAVVLTPVSSAQFFSLKVKEILCKPHF